MTSELEEKSEGEDEITTTSYCHTRGTSAFSGRGLCPLTHTHVLCKCHLQRAEPESGCRQSSWGEPEQSKASRDNPRALLCVTAEKPAQALARELSHGLEQQG